MKITALLNYEIMQDGIRISNGTFYLYRIIPPNLTIMNPSEKRGLISSFQAVLESNEMPFQILAMDKTEDLGKNKNFWKELDDRFAFMSNAVLNSINEIEYTGSGIQRAYYIIVNLSMSGIGDIGKQPDDNTYPGETPEPLKGRYPAPIANGVITTQYGWRINPITGKEEFHPALDIQGPRFSPIMTIADGEVVTINTKWSPYGNYIVIKHVLPEETFYTMYKHLSQIKVYIGQPVKQGETIGIEGGNPWDPNPGYSTGHHVHFEIRTENGTVNPADYIY